MEEVWHGTEERVLRTNEVTSNTFIEVNGSQQPIVPGTSLRNTILDTARNAGLGKFRVYLNGEEVKPSQAPETFNEGDQVKLTAFDIAG